MRDLLSEERLQYLATQNERVKMCLQIDPRILPRHYVYDIVLHDVDTPGTLSWKCAPFNDLSGNRHVVYSASRVNVTTNTAERDREAYQHIRSGDIVLEVLRMQHYPQPLRSETVLLRGSDIPDVDALNDITQAPLGPLKENFIRISFLRISSSGEREGDGAGIIVSPYPFEQLQNAKRAIT